MKIRKPRFYLLFVQAFWQKQKRIIILSLALTILLIYFGPKLINVNLTRNQQKIGLIGRYNPSNLPYEITSLISYGLTISLPDGSVEPGMAESWETQEKGKVYIFTIKDNLFWHDKRKVIAKDVDYSFSDVNSTVLDDRRIKFELKEPFSPFPGVVSRPLLKKDLLGVGDYKVKSVQKTGQIIRKLILVPSEDRSKPKLTFRFYPNEEAAKTGFKLGEVDMLKDISSAGDLEEWPSIKIESETKNDRYTAIFFNTQTDKFADKPVRQALAYAINKQWQPRAISSYSPDSWAYNSTVKPYNLDLDNAKKLLGQEEGGASVEKIRLSTVPSLLDIAEEVKSDWQELGIETEIQLIHTLTEDFEALLVSQQIPKDPDQYVLWHSTQVTNLSHYKSPKLDKLLEEGRKTFDQEERKSIYQEFQRFLVEETPAVFLFHPTLYTVSRK